MSLFDFKKAFDMTAIFSMKKQKAYEFTLFVWK